jgi:hypothetical protein
MNTRIQEEMRALRDIIKQRDDRIDDLLERLDKLAMAYQKLALGNSSSIQTVRNGNIEDHEIVIKK